MFGDTALSMENYDALLMGWNAQLLNSGVTFGGGNSLYCLAEADRANMIDTTTGHSWTITDGGKMCTTVSITATSASKAEGGSGNTAFTFTVSRSGDTSIPSSVAYAVTGSGDNVADASDFGGTLPSGTVNFSATETSKIITISVSGDMEIENDETFTVTLSNAIDAGVFRATADGTIQNDDHIYFLPMLLN